MLVKQLSVFLENKKGRLAKLTRVLSDHGINLLSLSISDTPDYGILRGLVNNTELAQKVLKENGFTVNVTEVIACTVPDHPGGLTDLLSVMDKNDIGIEYLYSFVHRKENDALILFHVRDPQQAIKLLQAEGIHCLSQQEVLQ